MNLDNEAKRFQASRNRAKAGAQAMAAAQLLCGIDIRAPMHSRARAIARLRIRRRLERERLKGLARHWSYDMNRHIALKQALDALDVPEKERAA